MWWKPSARWADPGQLTTTSLGCLCASHVIYTFLERKFFLLTSTNSCSGGAFKEMCVQPITREAQCCREHSHLSRLHFSSPAIKSKNISVFQASSSVALFPPSLLLLKRESMKITLLFTEFEFLVPDSEFPALIQGFASQILHFDSE